MARADDLRLALAALGVTHDDSPEGRLSVSIGVVVQLTWGAGSCALHRVPLGPRSTETQRYNPSLYGGATLANIIKPR